MDLKDLKATLLEHQQVEMLVGQTNFIRWKREFIDLLTTEDLGGLILPISKPTPEDQNHMDIEETLIPHPGLPPSLKHGDGTFKTMTVLYHETETYKLQLDAHHRQQE